MTVIFSDDTGTCMSNDMDSDANESYGWTVVFLKRKTML